LIRSFSEINRVDLGLHEPEQVLTFRVSLSGGRYSDRAAVAGYYASLVDEIERMPGVEAVGLNNRTPLAGGFNLTNVFRKDDPERVAHFVELRWATSGLFEAIGVPLVSGRLWTDAEMNDTTEAGTFMVITETLAQQLFPDGDAVGGRIDPHWNEDGYQVIGVVGDLRENGAEREAPPGFYLPFPGMDARSGLVGAVRTSENPLLIAPQVRAAARSLDPEIPVYSIRVLSDVIEQRQGARRFSMSLLSIFAGLAVLLGGIGIYGVLSFTVAQRTREMGVRLALGASRERVRRLVLRQALKLAIPGVIVGLLAALAAGRVMGSMLFGVSAADPLTYVSVALILTAVCAMASLVPAWRATQVDPISSLRAE
jgi:predicted permease